ncbi:CMP-N-acetylneuraminate-beta-galactosamide-alpha-2,3-sialyltransferase 1-like isoform X2 [Corticium candelabrum]|uniref:CMP-N-acetylneuraminate-beta-galactosamide- alpha-2,3-sialyltransferase 1-like isoform X2 n=1 Tax=Corticium candelabrum TaxID=121492 RepID=UPI002E254A43|nr:CMP-N-acetylneuraminate-beta-galactosamide-alpha-2,3-sialyltransferase 1-like isoform X2 [Corticium candelabrum]
MTMLKDLSLYQRYKSLQENRYKMVRVKSVQSLSSAIPESNSLWNSVGCGSKYPLLSCQTKQHIKSNHIKFQGNFIPVNRSHFNHPLLRQRWNRCAVVGSSGRLLKTKFGQEIDRHDVIVRINYPPTSGYEKHVGSRPTDIHFFGDKVTRCFNDSDSESKLVVFPFPFPFHKHYKTVAFEVCKANRELQLYPISSYIFDFARGLVKKYSKDPAAHRNGFPSSGFRAVIFSMMMCANVDVYGFGLSGDKNEPVHYYEKSKDSRSFKRGHDPDTEFRLLTHWPNSTRPDFFPGFGKVRVFV